jgi:hypothetical protein
MDEKWEESVGRVIFLTTFLRDSQYIDAKTGLLAGYRHVQEMPSP